MRSRISLTDPAPLSQPRHLGFAEVYRGGILWHVPNVPSFSPFAMHFRPILSACLFILLLAGAARAGEKTLFFTRDGVAISGYDAVAYFIEGAAVRGRADIAVMWRGAVWHFADRGNRERFEANPRAYAPQFGGYCAFGMAGGQVAPSDPQLWRIVDGKLYLVQDPRQLVLWSADPAGFIARGAEHWPAALFR